jgi:hypothetical protein
LHHLAGINKYLFLKDFLSAGGVGDQKKPCCRWPASAGAEKSGTVLLKLCGGIAQKEMLKSRNRK